MYGLGGDPFDVNVIKKIFKVKNRNYKKPLPILISDNQLIMNIVEVNEIAKRLIEKFWPGPLTIVFKIKKKIFPKLLTANTGTVGLRQPNYSITLEIIKNLGGYIIGTSANISGQPPPVSLEDIDLRILKSADVVIDSGKTPIKTPSTVVDVTKNKLRILRIGAIPKDRIYQLFNNH